MKVLITASPFNADVTAEYQAIPNPFGRRLTELELVDLIQRHQPDAIIAGVDPFTKDVLEAAERLRLISRTGVGLDSIDLDAAARLSVEIRNTPDAPVQSVAEHTVGLILTCLHEIAATDAMLRAGVWQRKIGTLLEGKTIGIVGCGRIGSTVAKLLGAFGCVLIGVDPAMTSHRHCQIVSHSEVLAKSDVVTLHVPLQPDTRGLIDADSFSKMKQTAILINTARGAVIDESALIRALQTGRIAKAAIDVYEDEPYSGPLISMPDRTVLTPHIASNAIESRTAMERGAVANMVEFFRNASV